MSYQVLSGKIEGLRAEMIRAAERAESLHDPQLVAISQQLDHYLLHVQILSQRPPHSKRSGYRD
ncbi:aspartyl-phosphate phosphatase Spo0E family protein [Tumebacillus permanentifrigoris]|uniref:Spo0E like sporulation regulatory protein n=1 Tax=Tumebacillus permanentifrigoris TaxID=378543 RepID=A0A316D875_9BACL|nr:aspartyl-phosphate phosphatase Spo0E family protein [Tumebacillus permanentifrigoris]PWK06290.1 Spo0E like sporulation regulatory protein [Tumebacillus permanentifrigoris]